jgi:hypothetical protein
MLKAVKKLSYNKKKTLQIGWSKQHSNNGGPQGAGLIYGPVVFSNTCNFCSTILIKELFLSRVLKFARIFTFTLS